LLKGDYDLGPGNTVAGGIGGVVGAQVLQTLIPALRGFDIGPVVGQVIGAAASGAVLTVLTAAVKARQARGFDLDRVVCGSFLEQLLREWGRI
jgi:hypothetical protein